MRWLLVLEDVLDVVERVRGKHVGESSDAPVFSHEWTASPGKNTADPASMGSALEPTRTIPLPSSPR